MSEKLTTGAPQAPDATRRQVVKSAAALGLSGVAASTASFPFLSKAWALDLPDPASVLDQISVAGYVREDYRELYKMSDAPLWDPDKDWIRTVDWEKVREELAGTTVRFAIGAADAESAAEGLTPFEQLSGIKVELVWRD